MAVSCDDAIATIEGCTEWGGVFMTAILKATVDVSKED
jgi:hypothetical protein